MSVGRMKLLGEKKGHARGKRSSTRERMLAANVVPPSDAPIDPPITVKYYRTGGCSLERGVFDSMEAAEHTLFDASTQHPRAVPNLEY